MTYVNEGAVDRTVRGIAGVVLACAAWATRPGTASVVLAVLAIIAIGSAIVGWSLPYALLGISTNKKGQ